MTLVIKPRGKVEFPFLYKPSGRYVHVVAGISDEPGSLAMLLTLLGTKLDLIGTSSYAAEEDTAVFSGFGRIIGSSDTADSVQALVMMSPVVRNCKVTSSKGGLLVDRFHQGLQTAGGEPFLMIPRAALATTFEAMVRTFGSGGKLILYEQGMSYGRARWEVYRKILGPHPESRFEELASIFGALGWGVTVVHFDLSKRMLTYTTEDCFECSVHREKGGECSFLRGMAVGIAEGIFRKDLVCHEPKCRLKGDRACEFTVEAKDGSVLYDAPEPKAIASPID